MQLVLPQPKWEGAEQLASCVDKIIPMLHSSVDARQFAASVVAAANEVYTNLKKKEDAPTPSSVVLAAFNAARIGLIPGSVLGLCYFIPRKRKCNLEIGYQGFIDLAFGNNHLRDVHCEIVLRDEWEAGDFDHWNDASGPQFRHTLRERDLNPKTLADRIHAAYCVYHTTAGGHGLRVLYRQQLMAVMGDGEVWQKNPYEMFRKSPLRRAAKDWKKTPKLALAIRLDEQGEEGKDQEDHDTSEFFAKIEGAASKRLSLDDLPAMEGDGTL